MTCCSLTACLLVSVWTAAEASSQQLDDYNVVWTSPGPDSSASMPLGNGDIGLNLWVEANGDLIFYLSKTDAWSGAGRLLKLGRVRVSLDPNPFRAGLPFRQTLHLRRGEIEIAAGAAAIGFRIPDCLTGPCSMPATLI